MANDTQENRNSTSEGLEANLENMGCDMDEEGGLRIDDEIYLPPPPTTFCEVDTNEPRLMISKIANKNFKSYVGTQIVGPFHKVEMSVVCVHIFIFYKYSQAHI